MVDPPPPPPDTISLYAIESNNTNLLVMDTSH